MKTNHASKDVLNTMKRQSKERGEIFVNHVSDKGLILRVYKEPLLNNQKPNNLI